MSLFSNPEEHADNPPETWQVVKVGRGFAIVTKDVTDADMKRGGISYLEHFDRKRDAVAALNGETRSWALTQYEKDARWYAGETPAGMRSWAECKADQERSENRKREREAAERRKIERQGITPENVAEWREALREAANAPGALEDAAAEMLDHITSGSLMDTDLLTDDEGAILHRDLSDRFGLTSWAGYYIDRIKYKGLDTELSALEILEQMERDEREWSMPGLIGVNA